MPTNVSITTAQQFDIIGTGTLNGQPAPLQNPITYSMDVGSVGTLTPLATDPNSVTFKPTGPGTVVVTGASVGAQSDTVTIAVTLAQQFANQVVLTPQPPVPLSS